MAKVRVIGGARGGRCVYCHDGLQGQVRTCPECGATWHEDCGAHARRCPTLGCSGPAPGTELRAGRGRAQAPPGAVSEQARPPRPRPGAYARFGPYFQLALSGAAAGLLAATASTLLVLAFRHRVGFLDGMSMALGKGGGNLACVVFVGLMLLGLKIAFGLLRGLPSVWRELGQLLDSTTPVAMHLEVTKTGPVKNVIYYAALRPKTPGAGQFVKFRLQPITSPFWLRTTGLRSVLVYGMPPPGPYILEFPDGRLALLHPDASDEL